MVNFWEGVCLEEPSSFRFFCEKRNLHIKVDQLPSRELTYPPDKAYLKMFFLFPRWDMLVSWRVAYLRCFHPHFPRELELDITDSTVLNQHSNVGDAKWKVSTDGLFLELHLSVFTVKCHNACVVVTSSFWSIFHGRLVGVVKLPIIGESNNTWVVVSNFLFSPLP